MINKKGLMLTVFAFAVITALFMNGSVIAQDKDQKVVDELLSLVIDPKTRYSERRDAQKELEKCDQKLVAAALMKRFDDENALIRREVILALATMKYAPAFEKIKDLYLEKKLDLTVREAAFDAIVLYDTKEAREFIVSFMKLKKTTSKYARAIKVIDSNPRSFVSALEKAFFDKSEPHLQKVVYDYFKPRIYPFGNQIWGVYHNRKALRKLNTMSPEELKGLFSGWLANSGMGKAGKIILVDTLTNPEEEEAIRAGLARGFAMICSNDDFEDLYKSFASESELVRQWALLGLAGRKDAATKPRLMKLLEEEKSPNIIRECVNTLVAIGDDREKLVGQLLQRFKDRKGDLDNVMGLGGFLGIEKGAGVAAVLLEATNDKEPKVRAGGVSGLQSYKDFDKNKDAAARMEKMLVEEKEAAPLAQVMLYYAKVKAPKLYDNILKVIQERKEPEVLAAALMALGNTGEAKAHAVISPYLKDGNTTILKGALEACVISENTDAAEAVIDLIKSPDWSLSFTALITINNLARIRLHPGLEVESMAEFKKNREKYAEEIRMWWKEDVIPGYNKKLEDKKNPPKEEPEEGPDPEDF